MTREKDDPEKRNLLNEQREEKKRRQYSVSKNKTDRRSIESSCSEHRKRGAPYKISSTEQRPEFHNKARSQSMPYQTEKKDSRWFWQDTPTKKPEDTCSCVSCALKRIVSSEYACIGCLLLLFTISIIVAFLVVFKTVPSGDCKAMDCKECKGPDTTTTKCKTCGVADSERLKRKIEMLSSKHMKKGFVGIDEFRKSDYPGYNDVVSGQGVAGIAGIDFGPSFRELNSVDESEHKFADLSNILDPDKNPVDMQSSEKLRDFYKKLVETDAKIKMLKKKQSEVAPYEEEIQMSPERSRRSLKLYHYPTRYRVLRHRRSLFGKHPKVNDTGLAKTRIANKTRSKRFGNDSDEPTGFIIEKKKLLVQYKPAGKKRIPVKKCQHAPAGTHTHEKQMMHPFYKNSQRLDLLLDKFLNRNLPEIMTDPFGVDDFFKQDNLRKPCKHPKPNKNVNIISDGQLIDQIPKPKLKFKNKMEKYKTIKTEKMDDNLASSHTPSDLFKMLTPESTTQFVNDFYSHEVKMIGKEKKKIVTSSPNDFEVLLSVSTIMNPELKKVGKTQTLCYKADKTKGHLLDKVPTLRRLMQLETGEDEENLGYEDFKEVLTDDIDNHDEMEKAGDRRKRENGQPVPEMKYPKFNPPVGIHNPNWKGAMPLYQDELNSVINNKIEPSTPTEVIQELSPNKQRKGRDLSDIEYVEDYLANKYDKLVQQAQAYSDYGVLDGKKESRNEKDSPTAETAHKIKLSGEENFHKPGLLLRLKRGRVPRMVTSTTNQSSRRKDATDRVTEATTAAQTGINSNYLKVPITRSSEGIRIEMLPTRDKAREDKRIELDFKKIVGQHIKLKSKPPKKPNSFGIQIYPNYHTVISSHPDASQKTSEFTTVASKTTKIADLYDYENDLPFSMTRGNRRLLSTGFETIDDFQGYKDSSVFNEGNQGQNKSSIDRFVDKLHLKVNFSSINDKSVKNYIEGVKDMNIKLFSTPHPYDSGDLISELYDSITEDSSYISSGPVQLTNLETKLGETLVTINKSSFNTDDLTSENFYGKILLTVKDPEFGVQHFNLIFDVPLLLDLKEEIMMMSDNYQNYQNVFNQFDVYSESTTDLDSTVSDLDSYPDVVLNKTTSKRAKRGATIITTLFQVTEINSENNFNITEIPDSTTTIVKGVAAPASSNSSDSDAGFVIARTVNNNGSSGLNSTSKLTRSMNPSVAVADNMTLSDFFSLVANWFTSLEYGKEVKPRSNSGSVLTDMLLMFNNNSIRASKSSNTSTDTAYPMYDSDMIENIGHRSRVLLAVADNNSNFTEDISKTANSINVTTACHMAASSVDGNVSNRTTSKSPITAIRCNVTITNKNQEKQIFPASEKDTKQKVKAIVKRNADDSNLIFWNDIYDDEYGIQTDKIDNFIKDKLDSAVRDKHSVKEKDFLKRSGRWVQKKFKNFAKNLKISPHSDGLTSVHRDNLEAKERLPRSIGHDKRDRYTPYDAPMFGKVEENSGRRETEEREEIEEDYPDVDQKSLFAALSANMKEVCKKAAKAVQQTRNMDHMPESLKRSGEDSNQGSIANALMQQLVRLLTELVDFQVQQKTCRKLPDELQNFLEWLTYNKEEPDEPESQSERLFKTTPDDEELMEQIREKQEDKPEVLDEMKLLEKEDTTDDRSRYLDNLHSVQNLLQEYEEMSDDDKSKMTGVKAYLEKQLDMLNRQLSAYDLYNFFDKHGDNERKKRDIIITQRLYTTNRPRRNKYKFLKNFGKKHTRTTAGYLDASNQVTDIIVNGKADDNEAIMHSDSSKNIHHKLTKRNLKDVYYKAVAEAKKFSTAKNLQKKDEVSRFEMSTAMKLN